MVSAKTRRLILSFLVALVWLGAVWFVAWTFFPLLQGVLSSHKDVRGADLLLEGRINAEVIPSEGLIGRYQEIKDRAIEEAQRCASEYVRHSECLQKRILESWRLDPYEVGNNFRDLKRQLADKAGHPDFLELGKLDDWESEDTGKPREEDFAALEKRTCIASVLVALLTAEPGTEIRLMEIHPPRSTSEAPQVPSADWMVVRHRTFPVDVQLTTRFSSLGRLTNRIVTVPPGSTEMPCMAIRRIEVEPVEPMERDRVRVELRLEVYEFFRAGESN